MSKLTIALVFSLVCSNSAFGDEWFCSEESSSRSGHVFSACGVGEAPTESLARRVAADNTRNEFDALCAQDVLCKTHEISVNPKRQTCSQLKDGTFKCNRLIEYTITAEERKAPIEVRSIVGHGGKIHKGMTKADLLKAFGKPDLYIDVGNSYLILNYVNKEFCTGRCTIGLDHDRVQKFDGFEIGYTDLMETRSAWSRIFESN